MKSVLIIEDNYDIREIYRMAFEEARWEVRESSDGLLGITELVDNPPTVVLLDLMMPEMNGYEFMQALKQNTSINIPVIVVSNLAQEEDKARALAAGADAYLVKSDYDGPELVKAVDDIVAKIEAAKQEKAAA